MWLINSSIGKKFIMALTGICLVLFVTFHVLMNAVAIFWPGAYNSVCHFLGANWYALIASAGLGLLFVIHIIDAFVLTIQNRKARGNDRYAVTARPKSVEWSSQNMLVLGLVVILFLGVHLIQFWARMQAQEICGSEYVHAGVEIPASAGTLFLQIAFEQWWTPVIYIIGFAALWFHMNHGFWSMWQSVGWDNKTWLPRLKSISCWWTSIVIALFTLQAVVFTIRANEKFYYTAPELQSQYTKLIEDAAKAKLEPLAMEFNELQTKAQSAYTPGDDMQTAMQKNMELQQRMQELQQQAMQIQNAAGEQISKILELGNPQAAAAPAAPDAAAPGAAAPTPQAAAPAQETPAEKTAAAAASTENEAIEENVPAEGAAEN